MVARERAQPVPVQGTSQDFAEDSPKCWIGRKQGLHYKDSGFGGDICFLRTQVVWNDSGLVRPFHFEDSRFGYQRLEWEGL